MPKHQIVEPAEGHSDPAGGGGNTKVTRQDWLNVAMDVLISEGVEQVKVLTLGERLGVSRSSFYWYFKSRQDLLDTLLGIWETSNTGAFQRHCAMPARSITHAVLNLFRCFVSTELFNHQLDFAVREWSRRSGAVRRVVDRSDAARLTAIAQMFERFGFPPFEAETRARILYYMQIGYYSLELRESQETRLGFVAGYLEGFTGQVPDPADLEEFFAFVRAI